MRSSADTLEQWLARHRRHLFLSLLWIGSLALVFYLARRPRSDSFDIVPPPMPATPSPQPIQVDVKGAVARPSVYTLPPGSIVRDAISAAGGTTDNADISLLNQAAALADGMAITVPRLGKTPPPLVQSQPTTGTPESGAAVNINAASQKGLESLPGIGPVLAQRIIEGRPYNTVDDILQVSGIGPSGFEKMKALITVQ